MKLFLERCVALILLLGLSPILLVISLMILLIDGRPISFRQQRIGKDRVPFTVLKLRTMKNNAPTRLGRILRATAIDELPQLWNIVRGEMRFLGPRPLTAADVKRLGWHTAKYDRRFSVRPGIIGLAQLVTVCDKDVSLRQDYETIDRRSPFLYFKIAFLAFGILVAGKSAIKKLL